VSFRVKRMREIYKSAFEHGVSEQTSSMCSGMQYGSSIKMMSRFFILGRQLVGSF
jgi:hypothetical protein